MTAREPCPVCGTADLRPSFTLPGLSVRRCPDCRHRVATHAPPADAHADYHRQYEQGAFLEALRVTRLRQAERLVGAIRRQVSSPGAILDFGAGRGFFLEVCRREGLAPLAGADTSELAVQDLRRAGIEAHLLAEEDDPAARLAKTLSFAPRVLVLLDVVEHLPPERLFAFLETLPRAFGGGLELLVLKVPVADGLLYGAARLAAAVGVPGPLRQLYQVGTWPPHRSYFTVRSLTSLLGRLGYDIAERLDDLDFEPELLPGRVLRTPSGAGPLLRLAGRALGAAARASGRFDTTLFLARPGPL